MVSGGRRDGAERDDDGGSIGQSLMQWSLTGVYSSGPRDRAANPPDSHLFAAAGESETHPTAGGRAAGDVQPRVVSRRLNQSLGGRAARLSNPPTQHIS